MRATLLISVIAFGTPALAHIKLTSPGSFQVTDALGGPNKAAPCGGAGTATGVVTTVEAGSQLTVTWTEPVLHPGHFRIGIATNEADFITPTPVLTAAGTNCSTAPVESPVAYPTLLDGVFEHTAAAPTGSWSTTVTVPMMSCDNCRLQLMQFMSSHGPPCFYYQCATLRIVMPDAGAVDSGIGGGAGGGTGGGAGGGTGGGADGGSGTGGGSGGSAGTSCGAASCNGCCVLDRCEAGTTAAACGAGGALCSACSGMSTCESGVCKAPPVGCGCTSAPLGVMAFGLALLALRRRRTSQ
jgi:uncharacterized protein (TIGR03382 family)